MVRNGDAPTVVPPGGGTPFPSLHSADSVTVKLAREATCGAVTVWESHWPAGDTHVAAPHSHPGFHEMFYILAGEYDFTAAGRRFTAPPGTFVFIPGGLFHAFVSTGAAEGRVLHLAIPGGIEDYFEEVAFTSEPRSEPSS